MGYQPHWDIPKPNFQADLAHGEAGEAVVREFMAQLSLGAVEVKTDRWRNGRMVVETQQRYPHGWRPSGLNVTQATWWVYQYHLDGAFVIVAVDRLKRYLRVNYERLERREFGLRGDNPTRGYLLAPHQVTDLLTNKTYDRRQPE
jgi:hypothetical protein